MKNIDKGTRIGNFIVDILVLAFLIFVATYIFAYIYPPISDSNSIAFEVLASCIFFLYYFLFEFFIGKTVGKMITKTVVVDRYGNKPKALNIAVRSLVRLIPVESISFILGPIGFHDLASGTRLAKVRKETESNLSADQV